jgi:hypothetical protein
MTLMFLCASIVALPAVNGSSSKAVAQITNPSLAYNTVQTRYYKSSIDGATLPCTVFIPDDSPWGSVPRSLPIWVDLHAFGGHGGMNTVQQAWINPLINGQYDFIFLSPWGRNYRSMYADTKETTPAPCLFDEFAASNPAWHPVSGQTANWTVGSEQVDGQTNYFYVQNDSSASWKDSARDNVTGNYTNYTVSAKVRQNSGGDVSAMGISFRRQDNNNFYLVDLCKSGSTRQLRLFKKQNGSWQALSIEPYNWQDNVWYELKASVFGDTIEVHVDNMRQSLDASRTYHIDISQDPYRIDSTFASGGVGLASFGGSHCFDDFRVQNEFLYGETDVMDCINQLIEEIGVNGEIKADPTRIYLSGFSMGGLGAWNLGLHYPDVFAAVEPSGGCTDLQKGLEWIASNWPDVNFNPQGSPIYVQEQDANIYENSVALLGGLPGSSGLINSGLHEYSARYILENAYNTPIRIENPEYDALIPNVDPQDIATGQRSPVSINFRTQKWDAQNNKWVEGAFQTQQTVAPTYANSQYVWKLWNANASLTDSDCTRQTFREDPDTGEIWPPPSPQVGLWDFTNYSTQFLWGAHGGAMCSDLVQPQNTLKFFTLAAANNYGKHLCPPTISYKTYDNRHNKAWWLGMEIVSPDADKPGMTRVSVSGNTVAAHLKNVKSATIDLARAGINTKSAGTLTFNLDRSTEQFEAEPISLDAAWNKKVTLKLEGQWYPNASYTVKVNGSTKTHTKTGTVITVPDIDITNPATLTITIPSGLTDKRLDDLQSDPVNTRWWPLSGGAGTFVWDRIEAGHGNGGSPGSLRIKDVKANSSPYLSMWAPSSSDFISVSPSTSYTASAFVKTRLLSTRSKVFQNGKYVEPSPSVAGVGIYWYNSSKTLIRSDLSTGIKGNNDWTPQEVVKTSPSNAAYAKVVLFIKDPDNKGSTGSAWFDDVRFSKSNGAN